MARLLMALRSWWHRVVAAATAPTPDDDDMYWEITQYDNAPWED